MDIAVVLFGAFGHRLHPTTSVSEHGYGGYQGGLTTELEDMGQEP